MGRDNDNYQGISVNVLRISASGKAVEVCDPERDEGDNTLWIPISLLDEKSVTEAHDAATELGGLTDLNVKQWFLEKEGWG